MKSLLIKKQQHKTKQQERIHHQDTANTQKKADPLVPLKIIKTQPGNGNQYQWIAVTQNKYTVFQPAALWAIGSEDRHKRDNGPQQNGH